MTVENFIVAMLELLILGSVGQIRGCMNLMGGDMKIITLSKILNKMVQEGILYVRNINNHKYYGLTKEYKEKMLEKAL